MKSNALIVFTRIPIAGKTKTRLHPQLSHIECADIHKCFLKDIYKEIKDLEFYNIDIIVYYNPEGDLNILKEIFQNEYIYIKQEGRNIFEKMYGAMEKVLSLGYEKCILIGTDIPEINKENILEGFDLLNNNDFVFGPSYDGGYYLVGMKKYIDVILNSSSGLLKDILLELENNNLRCDVIEKKHDIDEYNDLLSLMKRIEDNKVILENTADLLRKLKKVR